MAKNFCTTVDSLSLPSDDFAIDQSAVDEDTLYAFYDLKWFEIGFDIGYFFMSAEVARSNLGLGHIVLVIIPSPKKNSRHEIAPPPEDATLDIASFTAWRFNQICLPIITMFPSITGFCVVRSRVEGFFRWSTAKHQYPNRHDSANLPTTPNRQFFSPTFEQIYKYPGKYVRPRTTPKALQLMRKKIAPILGNRRLIVITLRQRLFDRKRNSNIDAWMKFAGCLNPDLYLPIFVPDTEAAFTTDFGVWSNHCFFDVPFNLQLRIALYEIAWLNCFVSSGVFGLTTLNERCRVLGFKFIVPDYLETTAESLEKYGFPHGKNPQYATPFQRWVWQDDDFPVIMQAFEEMVKFIEASERAPDAKISNR